MSIDLSQYRNYFTESAQKLLTYAISETQKMEHYLLSIEHIFYSFMILEKDSFDRIYDAVGLNCDKVREKTLKHVNKMKVINSSKGISISPEVKILFDKAIKNSDELGFSKISSFNIFAGIFFIEESYPVKELKKAGVDSHIMINAVIEEANRRIEFERELKVKYDLPPYLKQFGVNLNKLAVLDKIHTVYGRDKEIKKIIEILSRKEGGNSVMIIGEPGVGKSALVEGLAWKIEFEPEDLPKKLAESQIVSLQLNSVIAGTMFRGMFEERIDRIIKELKEKKNIILFVDEAHNLIGAGSAVGVPSDAANILKSSLATGEIQLIGATTETEFRQFISEDEAFERRFKPVNIEEPDYEITKKILRGLTKRIELLYSVVIPEDMIDLVLQLSNRYTRNRKAPDKPINWLSTAAVKSTLYSKDKVVKKEDIMEVISEETNIPVHMIARESYDIFKNIEERISKRVVGQKEAVNAVSKILRMNKGPLKENFYRPDGVLLFLGPTGVGKTELSKALAEYLFNDEKKLVRLDMSELKDSALSIDKLIGMPRGVVGAERGGLLTNKIKNNPYSVVLLDEVEKAHPDVMNLFLQVFDEGWLTDGKGKKVYFSDSVIIMTSNIGYNQYRKFIKPLGFLKENESTKQLHKLILEEVENHFTPEFLNRIDQIVVFTPLTELEVYEIANKYIDNIKNSVECQNKKLEISDSAVKLLAKEGYSIKYGARFLKRKIDEKVKLPVTLNWNNTDYFYIDVDENKEIVLREKLLV